MGNKLKKYNHIQTKNDKNDILSATVIHKNWYFTDSIATSLVAMNRYEAENFCIKNNIKTFLVYENKETFLNLI